MKKSQLRQIIREEISHTLGEEVVGNKLYIYHRTKARNAKLLAKNNFTLTPGGGRAGRGAYFVYDSPSDIKGGMDVYGGISLRYSIPLKSLSKFLIFDRELQTKSLAQQLSPISDKIDNFQEVMDSYNSGKLKQLKFIEEVRMNVGEDIFNDNFDGIIYSTRGSSSSGFGTTGTDKTIVVYDLSLVTFESISTDGLNYKKISNSEEDVKQALKSPESLLRANEVSPNSTIKKSFIKLKGAKELQLPSGLKVVGSLDLRKIPNLIIPKDLEVTNTLYVSSGVEVPNTVKAKNIKID